MLHISLKKTKDAASIAPKQKPGNIERTTGHSLVFSDSGLIPGSYFLCRWLTCYREFLVNNLIHLILNASLLSYQDHQGAFFKIHIHSSLEILISSPHPKYGKSVLLKASFIKGSAKSFGFTERKKIRTVALRSYKNSLSGSIENILKEVWPGLCPQWI